MSIILTNKDLFNCWISAGPRDKFLILKSFVKNKIGERLFNEATIENIRIFQIKLDRKWKECHYNKNLFIKKYENWLSVQTFIIPDPYEQPSTSRGRPKKEFHLLSEQMKRRKVAEIVSDYTEEELEYASDFARRKGSIKKESVLSVQVALTIYLDLDLSEVKYNILRKTVNEHHENFFPSLYAIQNFKKNIVPPVKASENSAEVELKPLMRNTAKSIFKLCDGEETPDKVTLICKWGMDGSSGHSRYKQNFSTEDFSDEFIFFIAFVPIKLIDSSSKKPLWINKSPSFTLFCRPIKIVMAKENRTLVIQENNDIKKQITELECEILEFNGKSVEVSYEMKCTMIDGSIANVLTETNSASRCFICNASPIEMNKINFTRSANTDSYKYGLSTLHCWIRFFECLIHISYRLPFKAWRVRQENQAIFSENKSRIQREFRERMGLLIDHVKQGYGTTNDGNTARKFFANFDVSAEITGLNKDLIYNFSLILRILSCGRKIKIEEFSKLLMDTRNLYLKCYSWYYMPSSVHKVLVHGCEVMKYFDLPIGSLSEEALEASHKNIRYARLNHTRKSSRENSNKDLMTHLLISTDPELSSKRNIKFKNNFNEEDPYFTFYIESETN